MARIGIDATSVSSQGKGVSRYQKSIVEFLSRLSSDHEYYVFLNKDHGIAPFVEQPNWHFVSVPIWNALFWEIVQFPYYARRFRLDLTHHTSDRVSFFARKPLVLFLFEIPYYRLRWMCEWKRAHRWYQRVSDLFTISLFPLSLRRAERIMVSSESTKRDLMKEFRLSEHKIRVIYPGYDGSFQPEFDEKNLAAIRRSFGIQGDYLLHFATGDPRENTQLVLKVFQRVRKKLQTNLTLLLAGGGGNPAPEVAEGVVCQPFLTGEQLIHAYQGARIYIDPSLYEGFGFQILEAMACGIPVIASRSSSIPEILGSSGFLVDLEDVDAFAEGIIQILTDEKLWNELRQKGLERAKQFSWQQAAQRTLTVYGEILNHQ